jgi:hypothetical protein
MDRQTALLVALGMLIASSLAIGISGWMLVLRDRRPTGSIHPRADATEGS